MPTMRRSVLPLKNAATSSCAGVGAPLRNKAARANSSFRIDAILLEPARQRRGRVLAGNDRNDLEVDEVGPLSDPLLEQLDLAAFHQLKTAAEVGCDPAVEKFHAVGQEPALLPEPAVDRLGVLVAEPLDHHEQHDQLSFIAGCGSRRRTLLLG